MHRFDSSALATAIRGLDWFIAPLCKLLNLDLFNRFTDEKSTVDNYIVRGSTRFTLARLIIAIRFGFSFSSIRSSSIIGGSEYLSQMKSDTTITTNSSRQQSLISIVYLFFSSRNRELMRIVQRDPASSTDLNWRDYQPENRFALESCARSRDIFIHH